MAEIFRYADPRPNAPGFMKCTLIASRTPGSHILVTAMDKSGRIANIEIPEVTWLGLLSTAIEELSTHHNGE